MVVVVSAMLYFGAYSSRPERSGLKAAAIDAIVGQPAPDFELNALADDRKVKLSDFRGKAVVLNYWATWCGPCKIEIPWLVDFQKTYGPQGAEIIGIAMEDTDREKILDFTKEFGVDYTLLRGSEAAAQAYGDLQGLPTTFYVGRDGKITGISIGLVSRSEMEENIKKALATGVR